MACSARMDRCKHWNKSCGDAVDTVKVREIGYWVGEVSDHGSIGREYRGKTKSDL